MKKVLATLITLTLLISALCFGTSAETAGIYIGTVGYQTLGEALAAVKDGETIKLTADIVTDSAAICAPETAKNFTIDGNNHVISSSITIPAAASTIGYLQLTNCTVTVKNLTVKYEEVSHIVGNGKLGCAPLVLNAGAKATLENVNFISYWGDGIQVNSGAELVIKSGTYTIDDNNTAQESNLICTQDAAKITIDGGSFRRLVTSTSVKRALIRTNGKTGCEITINGGDFKCTVGRLINTNQDASVVKNTIVINGGTFSFGDGVTKYDGVINLGHKYTEVTINGGDFTTNSSCVLFYQKSAANSPIVVTGGTFSGLTATDIAAVKSAAVEGSVLTETATSVTVAQPAPQTGDTYAVYGIVAMVALFGTALLVKKVHD